MRRSLYFVALVATLFLASVPAVGDPGEPTAPVIDVDLFLSNYASGVALVCTTDTTGMTWAQLVASNVDRYPASLGKMRIEANVHVVSLPSEHWNTRIVFERLEQGNGGKVVFREDSYYDWRHQNVPVSGRRNWELTQSSKNFVGLEGFWRITVKVTGIESANTFAPSCVFEVVSS